MNWNKFNSISILIIDDDPFTQELLRTILQKVPTVNVYQAQNAQRGLEIMEDNAIDLILLDLYMPNINGEEFLRIIRNQKSFEETPVILITTDRLTNRAVQQLGANHCINKPFNFKTFLNEVFIILEETIPYNAT